MRTQCILPTGRSNLNTHRGLPAIRRIAVRRPICDDRRFHFGIFKIKPTHMPAAFPEISKIPYEGPQSKNPLAFRWYNAGEKVEGKTMAEHLRFSVVYWHTFRGTGSDPFGAATMLRPWDDGGDGVENAQRRARVAFEFIERLGAPL